MKKFTVVLAILCSFLFVSAAVAQSPTDAPEVTMERIAPSTQFPNGRFRFKLEHSIDIFHVDLFNSVTPDGFRVDLAHLSGPIVFDFTNEFWAALSGGNEINIDPGWKFVEVFWNQRFSDWALGAVACALAAPANCGTTEVMLRDATCGSQASCINQNSPILPSHTLGPQYGLSGVPFSVTDTVVVTKLSGIGASGSSVSMTGEWGNQAATLNIWQAAPAATMAVVEFETDPLNGNFVSNAPLTITPTLWTAGGGVGEYEAEFELVGGPIVLPAGNYFFSVRVDALNGTGATWGFKESNAIAATDYLKNHVQATAAPYTNFGLNPGAIALDIKGFGH